MKQLIVHFYKNFLKQELRLKTNTSDITVIDKAKNLGQAPISPNIWFIRNVLLLGFLLVPLLILLISELLDNKVRVIKSIKCH
ncbi:MAG: hypothetical protein U0T78_08605 [Cloacibacterium normanense]